MTLRDVIVTADELPGSARSEADSTSSEERFRLFRLCPCPDCEGTGKLPASMFSSATQRCPECRGEGRVRQEVATCATPEAVGVAIVQLGREGEWDDCPFGLLDSEGEKGQKWLIRPWLPSPRNASDAGRVLRSVRK